MTVTEDGEWKIVEWFDHDDRIIDVYRNGEQVISQFLPEEPDHDDTIQIMENEGLASLAWVEYARKVRARGRTT